jgi:bifunctional DNA-binding transcriptional regulator/antitoxin component of YhaV-PrlF toxin-antitoxin module
LGEVVGIDAATIAFDEECLGITDSVIFPGTPDRVMQLMAEEPSAELLGPFPSTEANTRTVKIHAAIYIPFDLVSIVLGRDLSTHRVYELMVPSIVASGLASTLKPLVDFLTITLVSPNGTTVIPVTVRDKLGLEWDINTALIGYRREKIFYSVLPDLRPSTPSQGEPYVKDLANGVKKFVTKMKDARIAGDDRRLKAARPKTFREKYGTGWQIKFSCSPTSRTTTMCPTSSMSWPAGPRACPSAFYFKEKWTWQLAPLW